VLARNLFGIRCRFGLAKYPGPDFIILIQNDLVRGMTFGALKG
jgi:hypothetical protein